MNSSRKRILLGVTIVTVLTLVSLGAFLAFRQDLQLMSPDSSDVYHVSPSISSSYSESSSSDVYLQKTHRPMSYFSRLSCSVTQVFFRVILPLVAIAFLAFYLYLNPGLMSYYLQGVILAVALAVLVFYNFKLGGFAKPVPDVLMKRALKALEDNDRYFFYKSPITKFSTEMLTELIVFYLSIESLGKSRSITPLQAEELHTDMTFGDVFVGTTSPYIPLWYGASEFELAGRGKHDSDRSISVFQSDELKTMSTLPKNLAVHQFGDDSIGASLDGRIFVVADGVGGSIPPQHAPIASYVAALISLMTIKERTGQSIFDYGVPLLKLISKFYKKVDCTGSTTLTIAQIVEDDKLHVFHLGDSTCMVLRNDQIAFSTNPRQTFFNCPFQLTREHIDPPIGHTFDLQDGDIILLFSDGVGDNLWPADISKLKWAGQIAAKAAEVFWDKFTDDIPFNRASRENTDWRRPYNNEPVRGKFDDVSVLSFVYKKDKQSNK